MGRIPQKIDSLPIRDLLSQWRETVMLYNSDPVTREKAEGVAECIRELAEVLTGDMSPLVKFSDDSIKDTRKRYQTNDGRER